MANTNTVPPSARAALTDSSFREVTEAAHLAYRPLIDGGNGLLPWQVTALVEARCALLAVIGQGTAGELVCAHTVRQVACPVRLRLIRGH